MGQITLTAVRKAFGDVNVIPGIDLQIDDGEFVVFVGPSGCGKSTLLRIIAGLESCESGDLIIDGQRANDLAPQDRDIAMIFQNYALYPHMTVRQNIAFGLELRKVPKAERNARAETVAKLLRLEEYLDRKPGALSGGQRQRVAMGRAMARDGCTTFLMDEPLSNLDNALRIDMRSEIKELHRQLGATIIYVTHDQTEALTLADRVAVMKGGHLQQFDTPTAIYDRPANRFVASFLGHPPANFVDADKLPGWNGPKGCDIGLRPEALSISAVPDAAHPIAARIALREMTGSSFVLQCDSDLGRMTVSAGRSELPEGTETLWIGYDPSQAMCFDRETGARIEG